MERKAHRLKRTRQGEHCGVEQNPTATEILLSAFLWIFILFAIVYYYLGGPASGSVVEVVTGDRVAASRRSIVESVLFWSNIRSSVDTTKCSWKTLRMKAGHPLGPEASRALPEITLFAPCLLKSFEKVAREYTKSAHTWRYVQTRREQRLQVQHHAQELVTWKGEFPNATDVLDKLAVVILPKVGLLTPWSSAYYGKQKPMITLVPEPALDGPGFDAKYRGLLLQAQDKYSKEFEFTYVLPRLGPEWVSSELGVTTFPSIVVHERLPGRPFVFPFDMWKDSLMLFMEDLRAGCTNYRPNPSLSIWKQTERLVCNAGPVLQDP